MNSGTAATVALGAVARQGRLVLVAGLVAGAALPDLAASLTPLIVPGVALLLFLATLRVGPAALRLAPAAWAAEAGRALAMQTLLPLVALVALTAAGAGHTHLGLALVLTLAASPVTGSPGLVLLAGGDPAPALRAMAVGTALLPLTVLPVLAMLPALGMGAGVFVAALRLLVLVGLAGGAALALRSRLPGLGRAEVAPILDGAITLTLAVVVIALMAEVGPTLRTDPGRLGAMLAGVLALCFGLQAAAFGVWRRLGAGTAAPGLAVAAGNRNLALFFAALPEEARGPLLLWLGLYQIPMYLTPLLMRGLYSARATR